MHVKTVPKRPATALKLSLGLVVVRLGRSRLDQRIRTYTRRLRWRRPSLAACSTAALDRPLRVAVLSERGAMSAAMGLRRSPAKRRAQSVQVTQGEMQRLQLDVSNLRYRAPPMMSPLSPLHLQSQPYNSPGRLASGTRDLDRDRDRAHDSTAGSEEVGMGEYSSLPYLSPTRERRQGYRRPSDGKSHDPLSPRSDLDREIDPPVTFSLSPKELKTTLPTMSDTQSRTQMTSVPLAQLQTKAEALPPHRPVIRRKPVEPLCAPDSSARRDESDAMVQQLEVANPRDDTLGRQEYIARIMTASTLHQAPTAIEPPPLSAELEKYSRIEDDLDDVENAVQQLEVADFADRRQAYATQIMLGPATVHQRAAHTRDDARSHETVRGEQTEARSRLIFPPLDLPRLDAVETKRDSAESSNSLGSMTTADTHDGVLSATIEVAEVAESESTHVLSEILASERTYLAELRAIYEDIIRPHRQANISRQNQAAVPSPPASPSIGSGLSPVMLTPGAGSKVSAHRRESSYFSLFSTMADERPANAASQGPASPSLARAELQHRLKDPMQPTTTAQLERLFRSVEALVRQHAALLSAFEDARSPFQTVAAFLHHLDVLEPVYEGFVLALPHIKPEMLLLQPPSPGKDASARQAAFGARACGPKDERHRSLPPTSRLLAPLQRVCRYELLLGRLCKSLKREGRGPIELCNLVHHALVAVRGCNARLDRVRREDEARRYIRKLAHLLANDGMRATELVYEGAVAAESISARRACKVRRCLLFGNGDLYWSDVADAPVRPGTSGVVLGPVVKSGVHRRSKSAFALGSFGSPSVDAGLDAVARGPGQGFDWASSPQGAALEPANLLGRPQDWYRERLVKVEEGTGHLDLIVHSIPHAAPPAGDRDTTGGKVIRRAIGFPLEKMTSMTNYHVLEGAVSRCRESLRSVEAPHSPTKRQGHARQQSQIQATDASPHMSQGMHSRETSVEALWGRRGEVQPLTRERLQAHSRSASGQQRPPYSPSRAPDHDSAMPPMPPMPSAAVTGAAAPIVLQLAVDTDRWPPEHHRRTNSTQLPPPLLLGHARGHSKQLGLSPVSLESDFALGPTTPASPARTSAGRPPIANTANPASASVSGPATTASVESAEEARKRRRAKVVDDWLRLGAMLEGARI